MNCALVLYEDIQFWLIWASMVLFKMASTTEGADSMLEAVFLL